MWYGNAEYGATRFGDIGGRLQEAKAAVSKDTQDYQRHCVVLGAFSV